MTWRAWQELKPESYLARSFAYASFEGEFRAAISSIRQVGQKQALVSVFSGINFGKSAHQQCASPATMPQENATPHFAQTDSIV